MKKSCQLLRRNSGMGVGSLSMIVPMVCNYRPQSSPHFIPKLDTRTASLKQSDLKLLPAHATHQFYESILTWYASIMLK
jgi:hypothetical protein